ncbi:MAG: DUF3015 family protein [Oligoflexia bacterium]|nr:DUF3015 family protein [Oligoflexia bacterium]
MNLKFLALGLVVSATVGASFQSIAFADSYGSKKSSSYNSENGGVPGEPDTDGCGLGWQVTRDRTLFASMIRGTTNATIPPSFGMTTGTLGCAKLPVSENEREAVKYADANLDSLSVDMAAGKGEYLQAFAQTLGCGGASDSFSRMAQAHYDAITKSGQANALEVYQNVKREIQADPVLAASCGV